MDAPDAPSADHGIEIDARFVEEFDQSGYIDSLYGKPALLHGLLAKEAATR